MKRKIQFEHLNISAKEVAKYDIRKIKRSTVHEILERIHKQKMKKYHHNYCPDAVYRLMENKCILFSNATHDLILGKIFTKMMRIYEQKNCDFMDFYKISDFDPIKIMYARNQISEC